MATGNRTLVILQALQSCRLLDTLQLARLTEWNTKPILIGSHQYPGSHDETVKILHRLEEKGVVKRYPNSNPYQKKIWTLVENDFVTGDQRTGMLRHELDIADFFVAFYLASGEDLSHWDWHRHKDEDYDHERYPLWDARFVYKNITVAIEHDNGTEGPETLYRKVDRYITHAVDFPDDTFDHVIFSMKYIKDGFNLTDEQRRRRATFRANRLLKYVENKRRGNHFIIAWAERLKETPLGDVLISPEDDTTPISLSLLASQRIA